MKLLAAALALPLLFSGCVNRAQVMAYTWLNNVDSFPTNLCAQATATTPAGPLWLYGFYRRLNDGSIEFISFCDAKAAHMIGIMDTDLDNVLNQVLPNGGK